MELQAKTDTPKTGRRTERLDARKPQDIARAAAILRDGGTVAFPTETVYGLGANALDPEAVEKIFVAKQRPHWDPLIVHISDPEMLETIWAARVERSFIVSNTGTPTSNASEDSIARQLMKSFWPGPLTLLLPRTHQIPDVITAGRPLVGVRMPNHPVALELIQQAGVPIAAPSANTFGHTSPTTAAHVLADLDGRIDAVLDGGATSVGLESTVIGFNEDKSNRFRNVLIYRPGAIEQGMLSAVDGVWAVEVFSPEPNAVPPQSLPSPGVGLRHYAPNARLILVSDIELEEVARSRIPLELSLVDAIDNAYDGIETIGVMLPDEWNASCAQAVFRWGPWHDPEILARRLFAGLRELDDAGATIIICPVPTVDGIAEAIRDRLQKAAKAR